jgi:small GTP-binding protein
MRPFQSVETRLFRVITIGDTSVGKTSIITQLVHSQFSADQQTTIGAQFILHVETIGARRVEMQVWDTAGQERYRALGPIYYRNAAAGIIVVDLTNPLSFSGLEAWTGAFLGTAGDRALVCVVVNKIDLVSEFAFPETRIQEWVRERRYMFARTSAKTGEGIKELFHSVAEALMRLEPDTRASELSATDAHDGKAACC